MRKPKFLATVLALALVVGTVAGNPVAVNAGDITENNSVEQQKDSDDSSVSENNDSSESKEGGSSSVSGNNDSSVSGNDDSSEQQKDSSSSDTQSGGSSDSSTESKLPALTDVAWDGWNVNFKIPNLDEFVKKDIEVLVKVYKGEELIDYCHHVGVRPDDTGVCKIGTVSYEIMESGTYKVALSEFINNGGVVSKSEAVYTTAKVYNTPNEKLGTVEAPTWDATSPGVLYFAPLTSENVIYCVLLYKDNYPTAAYYNHGYSKTNDGKLIEDFSKDIEKYGEGSYTATVQALSTNIDTVANGVESAKSAAFHTSAVADKVSDAITEAMTKSTVDEKVAAIKENTTSADLSMSMQVDSAVLEQVKTLEDSYKSEKNVEVVTPTVSADAGVDSTRISMVGAAFNAEANSKVKLDISVPETKADVPGYNTGVQLDIKLDGAKDTTNGKLEMPITITMPIPSGVKNLDKLVLWHCHSDGTQEKAVFKNNGDGTITFTVTSFSIFVFAEETGSSSSQSSSSSSSDDNDSSSSSTVSTAQTATEEKTASVPTQYVVKRGDCMAKIARKYGMTLGKLIALNPQVKNPSRIYVGQVLIVGYTTGSTTTATVATATDTANAEYYTVQRGDSLYKIAVKNKVSLPKLKALNADLFAQKYIYAGQKVRLK